MLPPLLQVCLGSTTSFGDLALDNRQDQLRGDLLPSQNMVLVPVHGLGLVGRDMQEGDSSPLVGLEALCQAVKIDVVTQEMSSVGRDVERNVVVLSRHVSASCPLPTYRPGGN